MVKPLRVLIIEDSEDDALLTIRALKKGGYDPAYERVESAEAMTAALNSKSWDIILSDYVLPQFSGIAALELLKETGFDIPLIMISGKMGEETAVQAMKSGANDYVMKGNMSRLLPAIERELKEAESRIKLKQAERERSRILNMSQDLICIAGMDGYFEYVNPAWGKTLGYTEEDLLSKPILDFIHPEDHHRNNQEVEKLASGQSTIDFENRYIHRDGSIRNILWSSTPIPEERKMFCIGRDITERKELEESLREKERRYRGIIENILDIYFRSDRQGKVIMVSPSGVDLLGYDSEDDLIGKSVVVFYYDPEEMKSLLNALKGKGAINDFEIALKHKAGHPIAVSVSSRYYYDDQGNILGIEGIFRDIRERKRLSEALRKSEAKYRTLLHNANDAILLVNKDRNLVEANKKAEVLLGYSNDELIGMHYFKIHPEEDHEPIEAALDDILQNGSGFINDTHVLRKDGNRVPVDITGSTVEYNGTKIGIGIFRDITDRKQAENALKETTLFLESTIDSSPLAIITVDNDDRVIMWNPEAERLFGWSRQEVIGKPIPTIPDDKRQEFDEIRGLVNGKSIFKMGRTRRKKKDGSLIDVSISVSAITDLSGNLIGRMGIFSDISEHIQMEQEICASEARYRAIIENLVDVYYRSDISGKTVMISPSGVELLGYDSETDFIGQDVAQTFYYRPEERKKLISVLHEKGKINDYELTLKRRDGSPVVVSASSRFYKDTEGNILGIEGLFRDVSERQQLVQALQEEKTLLKTLLDLFQNKESHVDDIVSVVIQECVRISGSDLAFFGFIDQKETKMSAHLWSQKAMADCSIDNKPIEFSLWNAGMWAESVRQHRSFIVNDYEKPNPQKQGLPEGHVPIKRFMSIPVLRENKAVAILGVANKDRDYTESDHLHLSFLLESVWGIIQNKRSEENLRLSEENFRRSIEDSPVGIRIATSEGRSIYYNRTFLEICGYDSPEELEAVPVENLFTRESLAEYETRKEKIKRGEDIPPEYDMNIVRKDGEVRNLSVILKDTLWYGQRQYQLLCRDVTDRKKAELELEKTRDQLHQAEKLSSLGQLSAGIAHEILNPLNIISIELQVLRMMENLPAEVLEELCVCMAQVERIVAIAEDLKQVSRPSIKKMGMANINGIVAHVLTLWTSQLKINEIVSEAQYQPDLPEIVMDKKKIEQVILNLISNARDAMQGKENKVLRITTGLDEGHENVILSVADTGGGIKDEHLLKIFDPFFTTKEQGKGTGMGLSVSYGIISDHGGRIWAENNEWGGASFYISLPVKPTMDKDEE